MTISRFGVKKSKNIHMSKNKLLPVLVLSSEECENLEYVQQKKRARDGKISSKGYKKMWEYFLEISDRDDFNAAIKKLRQVSSVDEGGFNREHDSGTFLQEKDYVNWLKKVGRKGMVLCMGRLDVIKKRFGFSVGATSDPVETYFLFNTKEPPAFESAWNTCVVVHELDRRENPLRRDLSKLFDEMYPISLRISPYATLPQIKNLLDKIFSAEIKPLQRLYYQEDKDPNKFKPKRYDKFPKAVRDYIFANIRLPTKELRKAIRAEFGEEALFYSEDIEKRKSRERERRKSQ